MGTLLSFPAIGSRIRTGLTRVAAVAALGSSTLFAAADARAEGAWTLKHDLDPADGMNCSMETYWDDGSEFSIFSNANDFVGFYLMDPSWSLQQGQESYVTFRFGGRDFTFPVAAVDRSGVVGDLASHESTAINFLERWARSWEMSIVFPQGNAWPVNLNGTMATFRQWTTCHDQLERIARGGSRGGYSGDYSGSNPFGGGGDSFSGGSSTARPSGNPF